MGNEARFVNDYRGIANKPNALFIEVKTTTGEMRMSVWSGSEPIPKGKEILVSYGKAWWRARQSSNDAVKSESVLYDQDIWQEGGLNDVFNLLYPLLLRPQQPRCIVRHQLPSRYLWWTLLLRKQESRLLKPHLRVLTVDPSARLRWKKLHYSIREQPLDQGIAIHRMAKKNTHIAKKRLEQWRTAGHRTNGIDTNPSVCKLDR